jgi:signal transduction histidine kinase
VSLAIQHASDSRVRLAVRDTGPGIAEDQQATIFEKFRQLDASKTREHEGTGLGLAITKELTHRLGGSIRLESTEGEGSTFIVEFPTTVESGAPRRAIGQS